MKQSWVMGANAPTGDFPLANLPYGVFAPPGEAPRCGCAIGAMVLDLAGLAKAGLLGEAAGSLALDRAELNGLMAAGPQAWAKLRSRLTELLAEEGVPDLRADQALCQQLFFAQTAVEMLLPVKIGGYTDFYAGRQHAVNSGSILRGPETALTPNWPHMPIAYNGRTSTIVVSGTKVRRPMGQTRPDAAAPPVLGPSKRLDLELEFGAIVATPTELGQTLSVAEAWEHLFGFVLLNDWSARDVQRWEGQPLGPFQSKAFATTISPWVVTRAALEPFRRPAPDRDTPLLDYLHEPADYFFDIELEAYLTPEGGSPSRIIRSNTKHLYYSAPQLLAHHALGGVRMETGDILGSGTISGPERGNFGCLMEQTWGGRDEVELEAGGSRKFIEDGDTITLTGWGQLGRLPHRLWQLLGSNSAGKSSDWEGKLMRLARFNDNRLGLVRGDLVHDVSAVLSALPSFTYPLPEYDPLIAALPQLRPQIEALADQVAGVPLADVALLPPVASPRKIIGAPVNYHAHLDEALADPNIHHGTNIMPIDKAGLFLKATSSLIGASEPVVLRFPEARNDHEIELVVVIGRKADRVTRDVALSYVAGYAIGLDMTVRGTQERSMRKSCDRYSVLGPYMVTADELGDPSALEMLLSVNGQTRQKASTASLIRDVATLIERASAFYTLMPGDLLFTGTPEGVAEVKAGDTIHAQIAGLGQMEIAVR